MSPPSKESLGPPLYSWVIGSVLLSLWGAVRDGRSYDLPFS
jgi:hypothetical protein